LPRAMAVRRMAEREASPGRSIAGPAAPDVGELCRAVAGGDRAALGRLYELKFDAVYGLARRLTGRDETFALDVTQEAFMRALGSAKAMAGMQAEGDLDRWLARVVQTAALDLLRKERRRTVRERAALGAGSGARLGSEEADPRIEALRHLLDGLDPQERLMLRLRFSDMTLDAVARALDVTIGAAHGRIRRALARLGAAARRETKHD
jgi:RNA polymerase sigma-70 factor (ECF subfamily)